MSDGRSARITRRRALRIVAVAAGLAAIPALRRDSARAAAVEWRGAALGAEARVVLYHRDRGHAARILAVCAAEIDRLEQEFSLFRGDSALSRLNADGALARPSLDMRRVLGEAQRFGALSFGAFDVTIQPLWQLYVAHFRAHPDAREGPAVRLAGRARALVDYRRIEIAAGRIAFAMPGMAVTLNGIAQGYVTDRVTELLRDAGLDHVLVDAGELRALSGHDDGRPWQIALDHPSRPGLRLPVRDQAVATSIGVRAPFTPDGRFHHLIDPASGACPDATQAVTVVAPTAMIADAAATALCFLPRGRHEAFLRAAGATTAYVSGATSGAQPTLDSGLAMDSSERRSARTPISNSTMAAPIISAAPKT